MRILVITAVLQQANALTTCADAKNLAIRLLCHIGQIDVRNLKDYQVYTPPLEPKPVPAPPTVKPSGTTTPTTSTSLLTTEKPAAMVLSPAQPATRLQIAQHEESKPIDADSAKSLKSVKSVHALPAPVPITAPPFYTQVLSFVRPNRTTYGNAHVCYGCMASTISQSDFPNENCSKDFDNVETAVEMGIGFATCVNGCYTSVLRLGQYITTFRGCRGELLNSDGNIKKDNYDCSLSSALGTKWWTCTCKGHFCNAKIPNV